ncbi:DUF3093 domain-containing protein [Streptomyces griseomycini]|uniref:DUF3093 domain-containing protein n=1 Tax=Streptomyces griseomycini TaxID=66895 RepID=A0A7W7PVT1_9ACTN|nr:DUF3093 domain-containing protein [Streptomyces griseomycini]MBB4902126.1 hypothetical protein [Streptomyces griseomycini]GGQ19037.1 membrane protein [Streptomyces griseomycini]GGR37322.1 membrane protein [Streptomyces griseomycini]
MRLYEERLGVPRTWFWLAALPGVMAAAVLLPWGPAVAACGLAVVAALTALGLHAYGAARIVVTGGHLTAGPTRLPLASLGMAEILDAEEALLWRTRRADANALMLLRSYVPTALRIEIDDPEFPAPYLYVSTRQPATLVAVLSFARR